MNKTQTAKTVVFDSNVIINAYLAPPSNSADAIRLVIGKRIRGLVCQATVEEVSRVLNQTSQEAGCDLHSYFPAFLWHCGLEIVENAPSSELQKVDKSIKHIGDRQVVAAAQMIGASICTNDIEDINPKLTHGLICQTPGQLTYTGELTSSSFVKGVLSRPDKGCIAIRFKMFIGRDDFKNSKPKRTGLLEIPRLCSVDLITGSNLIVAQFVNGPLVELPIEEIFTRDSYPITVFVSYDHKKHVELFASSVNGELVSTSIQTTWECEHGFHSISRLNIMLNLEFPTLLEYVATYLHPFSLRTVKRLITGLTTDIPLERISALEMFELFHSK